MFIEDATRIYSRIYRRENVGHDLRTYGYKLDQPHLMVIHFLVNSLWLPETGCDIFSQSSLAIFVISEYVTYRIARVRRELSISLLDTIGR